MDIHAWKDTLPCFDHGAVRPEPTGIQAWRDTLPCFDHGTVKPGPASYSASTSDLPSLDQRDTQLGSPDIQGKTTDLPGPNQRASKPRQRTCQAKTTGLHDQEGHCSKLGCSLGIAMTTRHASDEGSWSSRCSPRGEPRRPDSVYLPVSGRLPWRAVLRTMWTPMPREGIRESLSRSVATSRFQNNRAARARLAGVPDQRPPGAEQGTREGSLHVHCAWDSSIATASAILSAMAVIVSRGLTPSDLGITDASAT
jgi:hypothetical protein